MKKYSLPKNKISYNEMMKNKKLDLFDDPDEKKKEEDD
jgi:hypothetical protein